MPNVCQRQFIIRLVPIQPCECKLFCPPIRDFARYNLYSKCKLYHIRISWNPPSALCSARFGESFICPYRINWWLLEAQYTYTIVAVEQTRNTRRKRGVVSARRKFYAVWYSRTLENWTRVKHSTEAPLPTSKSVFTKATQPERVYSIDTWEALEVGDLFGLLLSRSSNLMAKMSFFCQGTM